MRVKARGAYRMSGLAKKSGASYDMAKLVIEVKQENVKTANMVRVAYGYGEKELNIAPDCLEKFSAFPYPCDLELVTDNIVSFRGLESVIVDAKLVPSNAAQQLHKPAA